MSDQPIKMEDFMSVGKQECDQEAGPPQVVSMVTDNIMQQNDSAEHFFETLLQSSHAQIMDSSGLQLEPRWLKMPENYSVQDSLSPSDTEGLHVIKESVSPNLASVSPQKRSRKCDSVISGNQSGEAPDGGETYDLHIGLTSADKFDGVSRPGHHAAERSGSRNSTDHRLTPCTSDSGRQSGDRSESETELTSDTMAMLGAYPGLGSDDARHQLTGSVTPEMGDVGLLQPSMLEAVLTEKKLALLRSPEVTRFLQQQQRQKARERKLTHSSPPAGSRGDNLP